jgi:DNA repair/transcription protein MET18/MMS19
MPLLLRGLSLPDPTLRAGVINTLLSAAQVDLEAGTKTAKEGNVVSEHAVSLTNAMLQNSALAEMPDMVRFLLFCPFPLFLFALSVIDVEGQRVRIGALKYLAMLPKIVRYDVLHPQKPTVLRELTKALDDPKRAVRKEAVDARSVYSISSQCPSAYLTRCSQDELVHVLWLDEMPILLEAQTRRRRR